MKLRKGDKVRIDGVSDSPQFNGCIGVVVEIYGRASHKAIVHASLPNGKTGKLLYDEEYDTEITLTKIA